MKWITLQNALSITGHANTAALARWIARWNTRHPASLIKRRHGMVDQTTLRLAVDRDADQYTPGLARRAAAAHELMKSARVVTRPRKQSAAAPRQRDRR